VVLFISGDRLHFPFPSNFGSALKALQCREKEKLVRGGAVWSSFIYMNNCSCKNHSFKKPKSALIKMLILEEYLCAPK
jgi:hypothetical protein